MTNYIVCKRIDGTGTRLEIVGQSEANGPVQAAKAVATEGSFVCIPVRNWSEVLLGTETIERTKAEEVMPDFKAIPTYLSGQLQIGEETDEPREGTEVPADGTEAVIA